MQIQTQHPLLNIAVTAARKAGDLIVRALDRLETVKVSVKSQRNFVSEIDHQSEKIIIDIIHKAYPSHPILAEESGSITKQDNNYLWIIDPLDGTTNFIHGFPHFAVSIAVQYKNKIEHGVIYDPVRQELFTASRGKGAKLGQYRIRVSQCLQMDYALVGTGSYKDNHHHTAENYLKAFSKFSEQAAGIRRAGSAALDLAYVACGRLDGFWENGLGKWDVAAGSLLVQEAGGLVAEPNGNDDYLNSGDIVCGNPKIFSKMMEIIQKK
jgi:myo-inositol-1(or 4)-monophosphatase